MTERARRAARDALGRAGIDVPAEVLHERLDEYRVVGRQLLTDVLDPLLSVADRRHLLGENAFGVTGYRLGADLPLVALFGERIGCGLHAQRRADPGRAAAVGRMCALFNTGIVLFDRLCDNVPGGPAAIGQSLDAALIRRLGDDPAALVPLRAAAAAAGMRLRILLRVVDSFYSQGWELAATPAGRAAWPQLGEYLALAYDAELSSVTAQSGDTDRIGRAKSTLPFTIMLQISRLHSPMTADEQDAEDLADALGTMFWLLDDLADVGRDLRDGGVNAVLDEARSGPDDGAVDRVAARLEAAASRVAQSAGRGALWEVVCAYAVGWCA